MTIAERLRVEKMSSVDFDATLFMQRIEERMKVIPFGAYIGIRVSDCYKKFPKLCEGTLYFDWNCERYKNLDNVGVPEEHFREAVNLLASEGFSVYRVSEWEVKISLEELPYVTWGIHTYYRIKSV